MIEISEAFCEEEEEEAFDSFICVT